MFRFTVQHTSRPSNGPYTRGSVFLDVTSYNRTRLLIVSCRQQSVTLQTQFSLRLLLLDAPTNRLTGRLHGTIVRPTARSDWSVRLVGPTIVSCKRFVRPVGQTVGCLISSDCRSDCRSVWTLRPTGRTDRPVGRPITLQRRRYLLLTS